MKITILVMDTSLRFHLLAIAPTLKQPRAWEMKVMCIEQVGDILLSLGFLDTSTATNFVRASTTITPQSGVTTVPVSDFGSLIEFAYPGSASVNKEAEQGHVLIAHGETTEEALASVGFIPKDARGFAESPVH